LWFNTNTLSDIATGHFEIGALLALDGKWSGAVCLLYCPWSVTEDWEFDGETEGLGLPWNPERLELIRRGEADPNEEELQQWRQAQCRKLAPGSDWCWIAWITPITINRKIAGYAVFVCSSAGDPDEAPILEGVFDSPEEAKAALTAEGAVAGAEAKQP
jgi:hypothetical protein